MAAVVVVAGEPKPQATAALARLAQSSSNTSQEL
jgi:hypothetical protein